MFQNTSRPWIFQQDSANVCKAKTMQQGLENHVPEFISSDHCLSASPDLNSLNYKLWSILEDMVCTRCCHNLEILKQALVEAVDNFPMDVVHTANDAQSNRLRRCIRANGDHFLQFAIHYTSNKLCNNVSKQTSSLNFSCINIYGRTRYIWIGCYCLLTQFCHIMSSVNASAV